MSDHPTSPPPPPTVATATPVERNRPTLGPGGRGAHGFHDHVGPAEHVTFLVPIAVFAAVTGLVAVGLRPQRGPIG